MTFIYQCIDAILPFSFLQYQFMKNAFLAILIISPLFTLLGAMAVNNKMAFFSDALGHSALTGIAIGVLLGFKDPLLCMLGFGILLSLGISTIKSYGTTSADTIISVFSSCSMAVGIVILSQNGSFAKYSAYLIGDVLTVQPKALLPLLGMLLLTYCVWIRIYNQLLLTSIHGSLASSRGVRTRLLENLFVVLVSIAVMLSVQVIGVLTINALLILPAAAARNVACNIRQYHSIAFCFSLFSGICGLALSFYFDTAAGAAMVLVASVLFFVTFIWGHRTH